MKVTRALLLSIALAVAMHANARASQSQFFQVRMRSALLSAFWHRPIHMNAYVLTPDSFYKEPERRFPIIYWIPGFDGTGDISLARELAWQRPMRTQHSQFIMVFLDGMFNGMDDVFADSANNGPWGTALVSELMPVIEWRFRAIGTPQTRFVGGHSSGGWAALWLQITYPSLFGGEWSISPDPVDFRDFTGPDLTRMPPQNFFTDTSGHGYLLAGQWLSSFVIGPGWEHAQFESFNAVFSPRGANGKPEPLFDWRTGKIDPVVERYWEHHYDIARILRKHWTALAPQLRGKLHIIVGSADQFGLERPVQLLQRELQCLGSDAQVEYVPGADHFSVYYLHGNKYADIIRGATALSALKYTAQKR